MDTVPSAEPQAIRFGFYIENLHDVNGNSLVNIFYGNAGFFNVQNINKPFLSLYFGSIILESS